MAHDTPIIKAEPRERTGSRYAQRLRKAGRLPAVVYGHKTTPVALSVDEKELIAFVSHGSHVLHLEVEGKSETCLVKDLQYGYLGDNVIHVDFARVNMQEEVTVHVHLTFVGTPAEAHHAGAILKHDLTELTVTCKVSAIPEDIKVDLSKMEGTVLAAAELSLPEGITLAENETATVCSISFIRKEEEVGEEVAVDADGSEPEVITESKADDDSKESSE